MKLLSVIVYKWQEDNSLELYGAYDLTSFGFFHRGPVKEHIKFHSRLIVNRTALGRRSCVDFEQNLGKCYSYVSGQGVGAAVLVDSEYPMRVAFSLASEAIRLVCEQQAGNWEDTTKDLALNVPDADELFAKFQNPAEADKLVKIEKDLEEVKGVVMQSMDDLLKRGESLDALMQKSKDLSNTSVQFYRTAKKNNQCCKAW
jgi:synaptobrevin family protein YKT6